MKFAWLALLPLLFGVVMSSPRFKNRASTWKQLACAFSVFVLVLVIGGTAISESFGVSLLAGIVLSEIQVGLGFPLARWAYGLPRDLSIVRWDRVRESLQNSRWPCLVRLIPNR